MVELFSKSSQVEGSALVALRRARNPLALEALGGLGDLQERSPFYNSIREADTFFYRLSPFRNGRGSQLVRKEKDIKWGFAPNLTKGISLKQGYGGSAPIMDPSETTFCYFSAR